MPHQAAPGRNAAPTASSQQHNPEEMDPEDSDPEDSDPDDGDPDAMELEPGSRAARLYELLAVDLWWSLGMMGAAGVIATVLFIVTALGPLRVAGIAVGLGTALVYAGRLIWLRGLTGTTVDEWVAIVAEAVALIALTETTALILDAVSGGLL